MQRIARRVRTLLLTGAMIAAGFFPASSFSQGRSQADSQPASSAATKRLTIEAIYGEPGLSGRLASGLAWTPDSKQIAFFESTGTDKDARRELWTMDAATAARHLLISAEKLSAILFRNLTLSGSEPGQEGVRPHSSNSHPTELRCCSEGRLQWSGSI